MSLAIGIAIMAFSASAGLLGGFVFGYVMGQHHAEEKYNREKLQSAAQQRP